MKIIYVVGNSLVEQDNLPLKLQPELEKRFPEIDFKELDPSENFPERETLYIIDTVIGTDEVRLIDDIDHITTGKVYSVHSFDLGFTLKLMKKTGKVKHVKIIGVPAHMDKDMALKNVIKVIEDLKTN